MLRLSSETLDEKNKMDYFISFSIRKYYNVLQPIVYLLIHGLRSYEKKVKVALIFVNY